MDTIIIYRNSQPKSESRKPLGKRESKKRKDNPDNAGGDRSVKKLKFSPKRFSESSAKASPKKTAKKAPVTKKKKQTGAKK